MTRLQGNCCILANRRYRHSHLVQFFQMSVSFVGGWGNDNGAVGSALGSSSDFNRGDGGGGSDCLGEETDIEEGAMTGVTNSSLTSFFPSERARQPCRAGRRRTLPPPPLSRHHLHHVRGRLSSA